MAEKFVISDAKDVAPKPDKAPRTPPAKVSAPATPADVKKAMATLDSAYNLIATGLTLLGLTETASEWLDSAADLKRTNEDALKAAPKLAKAIASAGGTGGAATFVLTHGLAVAGVTKIALSEIAAKREIAARENPVVNDRANPDHDPTIIPGL